MIDFDIRCLINHILNSDGKFEIGFCVACHGIRDHSLMLAARSIRSLIQPM